MAREQDLLTSDVFQARIERLRALAAAESIDALLFSDPANVFYLAGFWGNSSLRPIWVVVPREGPCSVAVPRIEKHAVAIGTWIEDQREWVEWPEPGLPQDWVTRVVEVLRKRGCADGRIAIEFGSASVATYELLKDRLPGATLIDGGELVARLRRRKEPSELAIMRTAGQIAAAQLAAARATATEGVAEYEVSLASRLAGSRAAADAIGPDYYRMSPLVVTNRVQLMGAGPERAAMPHARASTYTLRRGDILQLCYCGPHYFTYNLGFDRPIPIGDPTPDQRRMLEAALDAHDAALEAIAPGVPACTVHSAASQVLADAGLLGYRAHRTGRSVGAANGEQPEFRESDETPLEPGMTFTVEPGIYIPGVGGARFGDTIAVTEKGYEMLTPAPYGWRDR